MDAPGQEDDGQAGPEQGANPGPKSDDPGRRAALVGPDQRHLVEMVLGEGRRLGPAAGRSRRDRRRGRRAPSPSRISPSASGSLAKLLGQEPVLVGHGAVLEQEEVQAGGSGIRADDADHIASPRVAFSRVCGRVSRTSSASRTWLFAANRSWMAFLWIFILVPPTPSAPQARTPERSLSLSVGLDALRSPAGGRR